MFTHVTQCMWGVLDPPVSVFSLSWHLIIPTPIYIYSLYLSLWPLQPDETLKRGVKRRKRMKRGSGMKDRDEMSFEGNGYPHERDCRQNQADRSLKISQESNTRTNRNWSDSSGSSLDRTNVSRWVWFTKSEYPFLHLKNGRSDHPWSQCSTCW